MKQPPVLAIVTLALSLLCQRGVAQVPTVLDQPQNAPEIHSQYEPTPAPNSSPTPFSSLTPPPAVIPAQQSDLELLRQEVRSYRNEIGNPMASELTLVLIILFGLPSSFAAGVIYARLKNYKQLNTTLRSLIERGVPVPAEILTPAAPKPKSVQAEPKSARPPISDFRKGLMLVGLGVGMVIFFATLNMRGWGLGLIPMFIGVAYLLVSKLEQKREKAL